MIYFFPAALLKEHNVAFEDSQTVFSALHQLRTTVKVGSKRKDADFADVLILEKARYDCNRKSLPFTGLFSFDIAAQQVDGIEKP